MLTDGDRHGGIYLRFDGESHRVDFEDLVGASVWLYPQTEVFVDLSTAPALATAATSGTASPRPRCIDPAAGLSPVRYQRGTATGALH